MTQSQHSSRHPSNASSAASLPGLASLRLAGCIPRHGVSPGSPAPRQGCRKVLAPRFWHHPTAPRGCGCSRGESPPASGADGNSPLHDDEQTFPPLVEVLVDVHDADDVRALRRPPVQLHFPAGLRAVLQHLREKRDPPISPQPPHQEEPGRDTPRWHGAHPEKTQGRRPSAGALRGRAPARSVQCLHPHLVGTARSRPFSSTSCPPFPRLVKVYPGCLPPPCPLRCFPGAQPACVTSQQDFLPHL